MNPETLQNLWSQLSVPVDARYLEAIETSPGSRVWYACDRSGHYHLLVLVPDGCECSPYTSKGLAVDLVRHRIPRRGDVVCVDLLCTEIATLNVFSTVVCEVVRELEGVSLVERTRVVSETLARWRWFWGVESANLSDIEALGLFGELWFLDQWVGVSRENVLAWGGDEQTRHDFQWQDGSVEVKTTARRGDGAVIHTVQHLDQMAPPESGTLYLFSLRVARDQLATNSLVFLASRCADQLRHDIEAQDLFLQTLSKRGYSPVDVSLRTTAYRIIDEEMYEVSGDFPRLQSESFVGGLPTGVIDVNYKIDMSACGPWRRNREQLSWLGLATADPAD